VSPSGPKIRDKVEPLSKLESIAPLLRPEPSGRTVEGLLARSTLQSGGGSLKARGSSRLLLVDGGFFVAQAISLSKACVHEMPARHDQEGAPQVGSNHWNPHPQVACKPLALLGEQAEASVAGDTQSPWPGPADRVWQTFREQEQWKMRSGQRDPGATLASL